MATQLHCWPKLARLPMKLLWKAPCLPVYLLLHPSSSWFALFCTRAPRKDWNLYIREALSWSGSSKVALLCWLPWESRTMGGEVLCKEDSFQLGKSVVPTASWMGAVHCNLDVLCVIAAPVLPWLIEFFLDLGIISKHRFPQTTSLFKITRYKLGVDSK